MSDPYIVREAAVMLRWTRRFKMSAAEFVSRHAAHYREKHQAVSSSPVGRIGRLGSDSTLLSVSVHEAGTAGLNEGA